MYAQINILLLLLRLLTISTAFKITKTPQEYTYL